MSAEGHYFGHSPFGGVLAYGGTGVDLFFVLSGFIIVYIALTPSLAPKVSVGDFAKHRFARIIPFLWFAVLAYAALRLLGRGGVDIWPSLRTMVLFPIGELQPNVAWTLRHEFLFYAVFALSVLWLKPLRWLLLLWFASPLVIALGGIKLGNDALGQLAQLAFNPVNLLFGLGAAVGASFLIWRRHLPALSSWWLLAPLAAFLGVGWASDYTVRDVGHVLMLGPVGAVCILVGALLKAPGSAIGRVVSFLGDASYSIYLTHTMFISAVLGVISHRFGHAPAILWVPATAAGAIAWGSALHLLVEKPIVAFARGRLASQERVALRKAA